MTVYRHFDYMNKLWDFQTFLDDIVRNFQFQNHKNKMKPPILDNVLYYHAYVTSTL